MKKVAEKYRHINYKEASRVLAEEFVQAEADYSNSTPPEVSEKALQAAEILFNISIKSLREALLGCALARVMDPEIDIRSPYSTQGPRSFSGRSLDEQVINPFLIDRQIPCSKGPYLASFRRGIRFVEETGVGLRDKKAYRAFLDYLEELEEAAPDEAIMLLRYLLYMFIKLREDSKVQLISLRRVSLEQYGILVDNLLSKPSGGLFPLLLSVALLKTIIGAYGLNWNVTWQGINVSDQASGVSGDITVMDGDRTRMVIEVTERQIDATRVDSTFKIKISSSEIEDYLFVYAGTEPTPEARGLARQLFAQGHEIGFIRVREWVVCNLAMCGPSGREMFMRTMLELLENEPAIIKMTWNDQIRILLES